MKSDFGVAGVVILKRWRRKNGLTQAQAAHKIGLSLRMFAYYESGEILPPTTVVLAAMALDYDLDRKIPVPKNIPSARDRWVDLVEDATGYLRDDAVVGRMIKERDYQRLNRFLTFARQGPSHELALTDPALFQTLRAAQTKAQLGGLACIRIKPQLLGIKD